jgi:hypothetical protein
MDLHSNKTGGIFERLTQIVRCGSVILYKIINIIMHKEDP